MDDMTGGIIATLAAVLLCACPRLFACLFGALSAAGVGTWTTESRGRDFASHARPWAGVSLLCFGLLLVLVSVVVGFLTICTKPLQEVGQIIPAS